MAATMKRRKSFGETIFNPMGEYAGKRLDQKAKLAGEEEQFQQEQQHREQMMSKFQDLQDNEYYQNAPLDQKLSLTGLLFGKDIASLQAEGQKITNERMKNEGNKPLSLDQQLNQIDKNYKNQRTAKLTPYSVMRDGMIILDFNKASKDKDQVLADLEQLQKKYNRDLRKAYESNGQIPPEGILEASMEDVQVKLPDGSEVQFEEAREVQKKIKEAVPQLRKRAISEKYQDGDLIPTRDGRYLIEVKKDGSKYSFELAGTNEQ